MRIALTGGSGFLGRYLVAELARRGWPIRGWRRPTSNVSGIDPGAVEWINGELNDPASSETLVAGCDAVVHSALYRPGAGFRGAEGDVAAFVEKNALGTIRLIESARAAGVPRFVFISTCAVHEVILPDRPLDEAHPLWPSSHYGAHKAAIEKFVHSYGLGHGYDICSIRPTGIYGLAHPPAESRWFDLVQRVKRGETVTVERGGKEVHARDVARSISVLLQAPAEKIRGQAFNCYDRYIHEHEVAHLARELSGSRAEIRGEPRKPKNQIDTRKIRELGATFGGKALLRDTISELLAHA